MCNMDIWSFDVLKRSNSNVLYSNSPPVSMVMVPGKM